MNESKPKRNKRASMSPGIHPQSPQSPYRRPHLTAFVGTLEQHKDDRVCGGTGGVQYQSLSSLLPFDQLLLRICEAAPTFNEHTAHIKICSRIFRTSQIQNRAHL